MVLLTVLYDTAARVSELVDICIRDVRLDAPAVITLHGKGGKIRSVPLMKQTVELIRAYFAENNINSQFHFDMPLFWNAHGQKLTRSGVTYILRKYIEMAQEISPRMPSNITPHKLHHTKAMHLVQANVNSVYIKDFLGHADISTTEFYTGQITKQRGLHWKRLRNISACPLFRIGNRTLSSLTGSHPSAKHF